MTTTLHTQEMLTPVSDIVAIKEQFLQYEKLKASLLTSDDIVTIQGKNRIKKSGFRKLATAFGISVDIIKEEKEMTDSWFIRHITAKAIAPNGRYATCCASCSSSEKTFNKLENDVRATAQTRASNRAIADLIWAGEVSAEEIWLWSQKKTTQVSTTRVVRKKPSMNQATAEQQTITSSQMNYLKWLIKAKYAWEKLHNLLELIPSLSKRDASQWIQKLVV